MAGGTLTLRLSGDVPLDLFAEIIRRFHDLIRALASEVIGGAQIDWVVDERSGGGAVVTVRGEAAAPETVAQVERAYAAVGRALERRGAIPYSAEVARAARELTSLLNGTVTAISFETDVGRATVTAASSSQIGVPRGAFGSIEGRAEALGGEELPGFTLLATFDGRPIPCRLRPDQANLIREAVGMRVAVEGWVWREPETGSPVEIDPVERVTILPDVEPGSYRRARAVAPPPPGAPSPEDVIGRLRDA